jgi:hypothetical protein
VKSIIPGLFFTILGVYFMLCRKWIAQQAVEWNYRLLEIRFSEPVYRLSFLALGLFFTVIGLLTLLRVIEFK